MIWISEDPSPALFYSQKDERFSPRPGFFAKTWPARIIHSDFASGKPTTHWP